MTHKLLIDRELLERIPLDVLKTYGYAQTAHKIESILDAPLQPAGDAHKNEAQPEVAENTGSRSMANKLQSQGCTGRTEVDGVAAPDEASDAVDIYAWSTFDGEGGYDLRLYENNETYQAEWLALNGEKYSGWVEPLCRLSDAQAIIDGLRGEVERLQFSLEVAKTDELSAAVYAETESIKHSLWDAEKERDQQAQRIGELEGLLLRVQVSLSLDDTEWGYSGAEKYKLLADIRAALSAGKEGE